MMQHEMTVEELLAATGDAYLALVHLEEGVADAIPRISACRDRVSDALIDELLCAELSWRERLLGVSLASMRGADQFFDSLVTSLYRPRGIAIVPTAAALAVAVLDLNCTYNPASTASLDRDAWDGELGFALDWLHFRIGVGNAPATALGPNFGQDFNAHFEYYRQLGTP